MISISKFMHRLRNVTYLIENPRLIGVYQRGGIVPISHMLDHSWLREFDIATVLDIGANTGQFAVTINTIIPEAKVYSFEPLPDCFIELKARMANVKNFTALNLGIGEDKGELEFERNSFSASSSFLKMTDLHKEEFPETKNNQSVKVKIERLDTIADELDITYPLLIKIDTQGYEDKVLSGGEKIIKSANVIIIETSFVKLYENQPLFNDIYSKLIEWGFSYAGSLEQLVSPHTGKILQADSLFIKNL